MAAPKTLTPGSYIVTVPAKSDAAFTAWRQANKSRVAIRQVRQTSDYSLPPVSEYPPLFTTAPEPTGVATYEIEVTPGPELAVPVIPGGGFEVKDATHTVDAMTPTASPDYHANEVPSFDPKEIAKWSFAALAGLVVLNAIVKRLLP